MDDNKRLAADWLDRIERQIQKRKKGWGKDAELAERSYGAPVDDQEDSYGKSLHFNILYSNAETIIPSVINSTPQPDIRERHNLGDKLARSAADKLERAVATQVDDAALLEEIEAVARDAYLYGRGIPRVRFEPGRVGYEVTAWRDYVEGPARRYDQVPWIAYRHSLDRDELERLKNPEVYSPPQGTAHEAKDDVTVWEVWDKTSRNVYFIHKDEAALIDIMPDPLGLSNFFPSGKPVQPVETTGTRDPMVPFKAYEKLAGELDRITSRINALTDGLRAKGATAAIADDLQRWAEAEDNTITVVSDVEALLQTAGGLEKAIAWWPIENIVAVLRELYLAREQTKQAIYEITGISDIVRGASKTAETATAQQIKTQWGSLRIKRMQTIIERCVRQMFLMTVELIASKFSTDEIAMACGEPLTPEEEQLIRSPMMHYRIDVESDSTVREDLGKRRAEMAEFLQATASYFQVVQPIIASEPQTAGPAVAMYAAFARQYNLGRQAESALDQLTEMIEQAAQQAPEPSPEQQAMRAELKLKQDKLVLDGRIAEQDLELKKQDRMANAIGIKIKQAELGLKERELDLKGDVAAFDAAKAVEEIKIEKTAAASGKDRMRQIYVYRNGVMVHKQTGEPMNAGDWVPQAPMVVPDTPGYASPIDGRWIEGRRARRYDLDSNNCVEAGDSDMSLHHKSGGFKNKRFARKHGLKHRED